MKMYRREYGVANARNESKAGAVTGSQDYESEKVEIEEEKDNDPAID